MTRVTISTITERGVLPQFYGEFTRQLDADDYVAMWRKLAAQAGTLIRVDVAEAAPYKQRVNKGDLDV